MNVWRLADCESFCEIFYLILARCRWPMSVGARGFFYAPLSTGSVQHKWGATFSHFLARSRTFSHVLALFRTFSHFLALSRATLHGWLLALSRATLHGWPEQLSRATLHGWLEQHGMGHTRQQLGTTRSHIPMRPEEEGAGLGPCRPYYMTALTAPYIVPNKGGSSLQVFPSCCFFVICPRGLCY